MVSEQSQLVTLKGLNQVYKDLRRRISDVGTVYKVKGSKTWSGLFGVESATPGDVYNIIVDSNNKPSDTRIYNGTNVVCIKSFTSKISEDNFSEYWDIAGGAIDIATNDTAGVIKLGSEEIRVLKDSDGKIITDPVSYALQLDNESCAYTSVPLATDKISGLVSTKSQTFAGEKTFNSNVIVGEKNTSTSGATLTVNGTISSTGAISAPVFNITGDDTEASTISGSLSVNTLSVSKKATIVNLEVTDKAILSDGTKVVGTTTLNGGLEVTGKTIVGSTLTAGATTTGETVSTKGTTTLNGGLEVTGKTIVGSTLTAGALETKDSSGITKVTSGDTILNGGLEVTGKTKAETASLIASSIDVTGGILKVEGTADSTGTVTAPEIVSTNKLFVAANGEYSLDDEYESISDITGIALFTKASKTKNSDNTYTDASTVVLNTTEIGTSAKPRSLYCHGTATFMNRALINGPTLYRTEVVDGKETQVAAGKSIALSIYSARKGAINTVRYTDSDTITAYDENYNTSSENHEEFTIKPADFNATSVETTTDGKIFVKGQVDGTIRTVDINDLYEIDGAEYIFGGLGVGLNIVALGNISTEIGNIEAKNGSVTAQSFEATSSRKFKENIQPAEINATELIDQIDVVNFNFIRDKNKDPKIGFIAEDTPSIFSTPRKNAMDVQNCIGILLKANQELSTRIKELEKKLEER